MNASGVAPLSSLQAFTPKLVTVLRGGYSSRLLRADGFAALIGASAVVPVILALIITAGVSPERGMISAGEAMCIVALFGGSSFERMRVVEWKPSRRRPSRTSRTENRRCADSASSDGERK